MGLARTWISRVAAAAGASLALPVCVLVAAGAIALGGGLGGLGGLGQVAAGPSLPDTGSPRDHRRATREVDVAAVLPPPAPSSAAAPPVGTGTPAPGAPAPSPVGTSPGTGAPQAGPQAPAPGTPAAGAPAGGGSPGGSGGGGGSSPTPQQGPAQQVIDTTRGLGDSLPPPVAPVTGEVLDRVLGPPPGR